MKKLNIRWVLFLLFLLPFSALRAQTLLYYNNFNSDKESWKDYDDQYSNAKVTGGQYILTHKQHSYSVVTNEVDIDYSRDFAIETTFSCVYGKNYPIGITFGGKNVTNTYYFGISQNGQFIIVSLQDSGNKTLVGWTPSEAILQGTALNKLRVEKSDNEFKYFVNDYQVAKTEVLQPYGNNVGLIVADQQSAAFNYLKVTYIEHDVKNVTAVDKDITQTIYHTDFNSDDENAWVLSPTDSSSTSIANGYFNIYRSAKLGVTASVTAVSTKVDIQRDYISE
ncbi:MAG TPA: hypothetical protein VHC47_07115, partial [Mucilaginibacter sp.]|nr:hypothetical protein [Mucilaginibacter sp.]